MTALLAPEQVRDAADRIASLRSALGSAILGQEALISQVLTALFAGGHVLLEGLPGLGKTELVKALAIATGLEARRVQFTPDLLPADITGTQVLEEDATGHRSLAFRPGPVFCQLLLADEINRASPKTQAALLEAMAERSVTAAGTTHRLPDPFFVLATQNPVELDGTYLLPEAQLDRFAIKARVTGVDDATLKRILLERPGGRPPAPSAVLDAGGVRDLLHTVQQVVIPDGVADWITRLVQATRPELPGANDAVRAGVRWGASPRAAIALAGCARAAALADGRPAVGFADVRRLAVPVLAHRIITTYEAQLDGTGAPTLIDGLLASVPEVL
jgi:MoxR-like ATPase